MLYELQIQILSYACFGANLFVIVAVFIALVLLINKYLKNLQYAVLVGALIFSYPLFLFIGYQVQIFADSNFCSLSHSHYYPLEYNNLPWKK